MKLLKFIIPFLILSFLSIGNTFAASHSSFSVYCNSFNTQVQIEKRSYSLTYNASNPKGYLPYTEESRYHYQDPEKSNYKQINYDQIAQDHLGMCAGEISKITSYLSSVSTGTSINTILEEVRKIGPSAELGGNNTIVIGCGNTKTTVDHPYGMISLGFLNTPTPPPPPSPTEENKPSEYPKEDGIDYGCATGIERNLSWGNCAFQRFSINGNNTNLICKRVANVSTKTTYCGSRQRYKNEDGSIFYGTCSVSSCGTTGNAGSTQNGDLSNTETFYTLTTSTNFGNAFANNKDKNTITIKLEGDPIGQNSITGIPNSFSNFKSNINSDAIGKLGTEALSLINKNIPSIASPGYAYITLDISSVTPIKTSTGVIEFKLGSNSIKISNANLNFKEPYIGEIQTKNPSTGLWDGSPSIGTTMDYKLIIKKVDGANISITKPRIIEAIPSFDAGLLSLSSKTNSSNFINNKLKGDGNGISLSNKSVSEPTLKQYTITEPMEVLFSTRINTTSNASGNIDDYIPSIKIEDTSLSYNLDNKFVRYNISAKLTGEEFFGVRVIGGIQGGGNSEFTGQDKNISAISSLDGRTNIRKNAFTNINGMNHDQTINGVKYFEGDITIGGNLDYETLVVRNGNVTINQNLNPANKKLFGIIVLQDNYDVNFDFNKQGNVYIMPNVTEINAVIYADGGLISVNSSGKVYNGDSTQRTSELKNQLLLNGSLFTRNTIGGAVITKETNGKYTLPGGALTSDFETAFQYDLNYLRRGNQFCKETLKKCTYKEPFIIKYDSRIITHPPKLFSN